MGPIKLPEKKREKTLSRDNGRGALQAQSVIFTYYGDDPRGKVYSEKLKVEEKVVLH